MLMYVLGIITGIAVSVLNVALVRVDSGKASEAVRRIFTSDKAEVIDMTPPEIDL